MALVAQVGAPAVVLEAGDRPRAVAEVGLDRDVADQPLARLAHRLQVGQPEPGQALLAQLVAVAEQLVAAADGEQDGSVVDRRRQRLALARDHVGGDGTLVAVLAAAEVEEVVGRGVDALAGAGGGVGEADPTPLAAPLQEEDVAAVGVDVHLVRVEGEQAELHQASFPSRTTVEPTWIVGRADRRGARPAPDPTAAASLLQLGRREGHDPHLVRLLAQLAGRRDGLAEAVDDDFVRPDRGLDREARVDPAIDLAHVGQRWRRVVRRRHLLQDRRPRSTRPAPGAAATLRRQAARSPCALEQLQRLHRRQRQRAPGDRARTRGRRR